MDLIWECEEGGNDVGANSSTLTGRKLLKLIESDDKGDQIYAKMLSQAIDRRVDLELSQSIVGERSGLNKSTISRIERGDTTVNVKTFLKYLDSLDIEWDLRKKRT